MTERRIDCPRWDAEDRTLWFGAVVVKVFKKAAENQCIILEALEASKWRRTIVAPECFLGSPKTRTALRQAVESLNRRQMAGKRILFGKLGGQITWEPRKQDASCGSPLHPSSPCAPALAAPSTGIMEEAACDRRRESNASAVSHLAP